MASKKWNETTFCFQCLLLFVWLSHCQPDTLQQGKKLKDGMQLFSASGIFRLGFFQLRPSNYSYLGISYNTNDKNKPVWIANRDNPLPDNSGTLEIDQFGNFKISHNVGDSIFLYSTKEATSNKRTAVLLDSGNLVLREMSKELWQSFDYPTDTLLPGMKLGFDSETGLNRTLTSWRGDDFPALGSFTLSVDSTGIAQMIIRWRESLYWNSGAYWQVSGCFNSSLNELCEFYKFSYKSNEKERYFNYSVSKEVTIFPRLTLTAEGELRGFGVNNLMFTEVSCINNDGDNDNMGSKVMSGCVEQKLPECRRPHDKFVAKVGVMSRDGFKFSRSENMSLVDCWDKCFRNCSCVAYASVYKNGSTGCEIWTKGSSFTEYNLATLREIHILESGVRMWSMWLIILVGGTAVFPFLFSSLYLMWKKCKARGNRQRMKQDILLQELVKAGIKRHKDGKANNELQIFSFESISTATNGFSAANKLGEGGFGPVYKGQLMDGPEIAIKRLSRSSGQGLVEFKNEALLIAKLQHTNLVRLFGVCIQEEEKILIYEYMPNKSLDFFLFGDDRRKSLLDWKRRFSVIEGIAQGLVYLHKYSRLKVIHRDLKASNILLDKEMNPKISDFGMARIFALNKSEENTVRVVGTYGYMSPEYAIHGVVSVKTDVFSFGVILLEIVSGKKNNSHLHFEYPLNLIGYAWQLWNEGRALDLVDPSLGDDYPSSEVLNCIHIGLLCVQDHAPDRPTMPDVVSMLSNDTTLLPRPKQPAFFVTTVVEGVEVTTTRKESENCSINEVTMSVMEAR